VTNSDRCTSFSVRIYEEEYVNATSYSRRCGGTNLRPREVTLASRGVLYLDEIAEFPRATLEVSRQPLEDGSVTIARAAGVEIMFTV
jgi:magnesium chelatase family protein